MQVTQEMQVWTLGWEDPLEEGIGNPLQYSCLENPMNRRAWGATVYRVAKYQTWLKWLSKHARFRKTEPVYTYTRYLYIQTSFPGGSGDKSICLQCGRHGFNPWVGKIPWRSKWQPTPVLLPGKLIRQQTHETKWQFDVCYETVRASLSRAVWAGCTALRPPGPRTVPWTLGHRCLLDTNLKTLQTIWVGCLGSGGIQGEQTNMRMIYPSEDFMLWPQSEVSAAHRMALMKPSSQKA